MEAASCGEVDTRTLARPELAVSGGEARSFPRGQGAQKPVDHQLNVFLMASSKSSAAFNRPARNQASHLVPGAGTATGPRLLAMETRPSSTERREAWERS